MSARCRVVREPIDTTALLASCASSGDGAAHSHHFWSLALAVHAAQAEPEIYIHVAPRKKPFHRIDRRRLM